jgi:hypothetical protein
MFLNKEYMLDLIIESLKHTKSSNKLILRAQGRYKLPSNFKEIKKTIKLIGRGK